ncbi:MAG: RagB/SusD family nutrient uptake outer membrane protein [Ferruginibacter sp.]|nr:RagB/SusD family nutrient uptake outer membrane protein [Ferruginibacter sp.]
MKLIKTISLKYCGLLLLVLLAVSSCRKTELEPVEWIREELVFDTADTRGVLADWFLNDIYNYIPGGFNRIGNDFLDAATGDAIASRNNTVVEYYTNGRISVLNNPDPYWSNSYFMIRKSNMFLANINKVPVPALTKQYWRADARFLRALAYFELVKRYGGVPLVDDKLFTLEDDIQLPRNTFEQCVNYIITECDIIRDSLRKEPIADGEWGRIPRGAAVALKCRILLYAASPLLNGGGIETDPALRVLTGYPAADPARWQKVIAAAEEFKTLGYYTLQTSLGSIFTTKKNSEVILAKQTFNNFSLESTQSPVGYINANVFSQGLTSPTQNFVDAFTMVNGLPITDPASGYSAVNPYAGRDARFAATVFYNGVRWLSRNVETFEGGKDKPNLSSIPVQTKTGYYLRKFTFDFTNSTAYSNQSHNFILFRYAEILLNYAEALNEAGRTEDAVQQIILIRKRAGIANGTNNRNGIKAGISQAEMRDIIRTERRVELAFEEHRFWDLRRWKIADQVLNSSLTGMKIISSGTTLTYQVVPVTNIVFTNRLYHMPIPYDETTKNRKLLQNEGW